MVTIEELIEASKRIEPSSRPGCFKSIPAIELMFKHDNKLVHVDEVDLNGRYPSTAHIVEKGYWWNLDMFDLPPQITTIAC